MQQQDVGNLKIRYDEPLIAGRLVTVVFEYTVGAGGMCEGGSVDGRGRDKRSSPHTRRHVGHLESGRSPVGCRRGDGAAQGLIWEMSAENPATRARRECQP